jgi:hypothetical protein
MIIVEGAEDQNLTSRRYYALEPHIIETVWRKVQTTSASAGSR